MRLVIADTSPLNYLVQIGLVDLLPQLFARTIIPAGVRAELSDSLAPPLVRTWIDSPPAWLEIQEPIVVLPVATTLDNGEAEAISLALTIHADLLLIDERQGARIAKENGLLATGTLGVLTRAAQRGLIDLADSLDRLRQTSFRHRPGLFDAVLAAHNKLR